LYTDFDKQLALHLDSEITICWIPEHYC